MNRSQLAPKMNSAKKRTADFLVIGAGMAGMAAAAALQQSGRQVLVVDKGRGVGGRMATRREGDATFDHGAQFVTARDSRFVEWLERARSAGVAVEWCRGFDSQTDGHLRWRGLTGMSSLAKHMGSGLDVIQQAQVSLVRRSSDSWIVCMSDGEVWSAKSLIITAPLPQALMLLEAGEVPLESEFKQQLSAIDYERCFAVMAVLDGPSRLPPLGGFTPAHEAISWIADNQLKGVSVAPAVTLHATHFFSVQHWDRDREETAKRLLLEAKDWIGAQVKSFRIHGWRFSRPMATHPESCAVVCSDPPLVLAGDAFCGPRVEGAVLSGWAAAEAVIQLTRDKSSLGGC